MSDVNAGTSVTRLTPTSTPPVELLSASALQQYWFFGNFLLYVNGKACDVIEAKKKMQFLQVYIHTTKLPAIWAPSPKTVVFFASFRPRLLVQRLAYLSATAASHHEYCVHSAKSCRAL